MNPSKILATISNEYQELLGNNLCGIYVHGSLAFNCFNWKNSDIDFIVVVYEPLTQAQKESVISTLLRLNPLAPPKGFEMSVVLYQDCRDFKYPTPFQLHFSNTFIQQASENLSEYCQAMYRTDPDLAAHFTVINKHGLVLYGKAIHDVFAPVPKEDYLASIQADISNAVEEIISEPVYIILNLCRVSAFIEEDLVLSKAEGGEWGLANLPSEYSALIQNALDAYTSDQAFKMDNGLRLSFASHVINRNSFITNDEGAS